MKTILVPTDFSATADNACKYAIELARQTQAGIILMHTYETPVLYSDMPMLEMHMDFASLRDAALDKLTKYSKRITRYAKDIKVELLLQQGLASAGSMKLLWKKKWIW